MKVFLDLDEEKQPYLSGFISCAQLDKPRQVRFYLDTGSTITTLLDIDVMKLGLKWTHLEQTECITATGPAHPYILPIATIFLKALIDNETKVYPFELDKIHLIPPTNPLSIFPIQYEFGFSLLGLDILQKFSIIKMNWNDKKFVLET